MGNNSQYFIFRNRIFLFQERAFPLDGTDRKFCHLGYRCGHTSVDFSQIEGEDGKKG